MRLRLLLAALAVAAPAAAQTAPKSCYDNLVTNSKNVCEDKACMKDPRIFQRCDMLGDDEHMQKPTSRTETAAQCMDHKDNDGDGKFDCDDEDCLKDARIKQHCSWIDSKHGGHSKTESGGACFDRKDNDGDGKCDCEDPDCLKGPHADICRNTNHGGCHKGATIRPEDIKKCPLAGPGDKGPDTRYESKIKEFMKACCHERLDAHGDPDDGGYGYGNRRRVQGDPNMPVVEEPPPPPYVSDFGWCRLPRPDPNNRAGKACGWECAVIFIPTMNDCQGSSIYKEVLNISNAKIFATECEMAEPEEDMYGDEETGFHPPPPPPCGCEWLPPCCLC